MEQAKSLATIASIASARRPGGLWRPHVSDDMQVADRRVTLLQQHCSAARSLAAGRWGCGYLSLASRGKRNVPVCVVDVGWPVPQETGAFIGNYRLLPSQKGAGQNLLTACPPSEVSHLSFSFPGDQHSLAC